MPVRYADIVKRDEKRELDNGVKPDAIVSEKSTEIRKNTRRRNYNYNMWEYAYFPHLLEMYNLIYDEWTPKDMLNFCRFIYRVSYGEISPYLNDMTEEQELLYFEYIIKRNNL